MKRPSSRFARAYGALASVVVGWSPDWIEAVGTCIAAGGTTLAFIWQKRALDEERHTRQNEVARLDRERIEADEAQARAVVLYDPQYHEDAQYIDEHEFSIKVGNFGISPVTNVAGILDFQIDDIDPILVTEDWDSRNLLTVVPPGESRTLTWQMPDAVAERLVGMASPPQTDFFVAEISFTDARGNRRRLNSESGLRSRAAGNSAGPAPTAGLGRRVRAAVRALRESA